MSELNPESNHELNQKPKSELEFIQICKNGDIDIIESVIRNKYIELKNDHMSHDLMLHRYKQYLNFGLSGACEGGHLNVISLMIGLGADDLNLALNGACRNGDLNIIELIIQEGARGWDHGLSGACWGGHLNIIKMMIEKGANRWEWGLDGACSGGHLNIVDLMIEKGANDWNTGLYMACESRNLNIIKRMIELGATNLGYISKLVPDLIDSDIVEVMIKRKISFESFLKYPKDKGTIFKLHELEMPTDNFKDIKGFDEFIKDIKEKQKAVKDVVSSYMANVLAGIVAGYVIN